MKRQGKRCRLSGGPYDGWTGDFFDVGQNETLLGPPDGHKVFAYRRQPHGDRDAVVPFAYDQKLTVLAAREAGMSEDDIRALVT